MTGANSRYLQYYYPLPRNFFAPGSTTGYFTTAGYPLRHNQYLPLHQRRQDINITRLTDHKYLNEIHYGRDIDVEDFSECPPGSHLDIPGGFALLLSCVDSNRSTMYMSVGAIHDRSFTVPHNRTFHYFFLIFRWNPYGSEKIRFFNINYVDNMINHHFPHRTRSYVRRSKRNNSLKVGVRVHVKSSLPYFPYY